MRFEKNKVEDLARPGQVKVVFKDKHTEATITATNQGVNVHTLFELTTQEELATFAFWLSQAWTEHRKLKAAISKGLLC